MTSLRKLKPKDAQYMLGWMHDKDIASCFRFDSLSFTLDDVLNFIDRSIDDHENLHYAITDETDEYLGTISLKEIDYQKSQAEYAISLRKKCHGQNVAKQATDLLLDIAFNKLKLNRVYLNVLQDNKRAIRFYEKYGFKPEDKTEEIEIKNIKKKLSFYNISRSDFNEIRN